MSDKRKTVKLNRDVKVNAATVVIAAILVYVVIRVVVFASKKPITTYKVNKSNINNNIELTGLAVREETVLKAMKSGYICYYIRDGEKITKNSTVCTVDESGHVYQQISDAESYDNLLTKEDYKEIRSVISLYKVGYNDSRFYDAYNFENNINNKVLELTNEIIMQQVGSNDPKLSFSSIVSPYSGLVTYYLDGFEDYTVQTVTRADFDRSGYAKETLKTGDIVSTGTPVVKIITSENWNIVAPVTDEQAKLLEGKSRIAFSINNSSYKVTAPFEILTKDDGQYISISLESFLYNFMGERYLSIEIFMEENSGLKVPASAVTTKNVYKIPIRYFSAGSNQSSNNRLNVQIKDENGEVTIKQVSPTIYKSDEEFCYVDPLVFDETDVLLDIVTNQSVSVATLGTDEISGVYSANRGIAEFRMVHVIKTIDDFVLIKADEGVKVYDNIILDSTKVTENQIIY